jgi:ElaB/YqjD/DUF883 family membrane-anchored ribosome-binding protein
MNSTQDRLDEAARQAHNGVNAGQRYAHDAVERIAGTAQELGEQVRPAVNRLTARAEDLARQGSNWVKHGSERVRTQAVKASDRTVGYVRDEPVRSVLMAAAAGALLYAVIRALGSSSSHRHDS